MLDDQYTALLKALADRGLHYSTIAIQQNADITVPALDETFQNLIDVRLTDYDVVLVRSDVDVSQFKLEGVQKKYFDAILGFPVGGQTIPFVRGWIAIDAKIRGKNFRIVTTHLETFSSDYQQAQTDELLKGPHATALPVILAGDLNSDALVSELGQWAGLRHGHCRGISGRVERASPRRFRRHLADASGRSALRVSHPAAHRSDPFEKRWHGAGRHSADRHSCR